VSIPPSLTLAPGVSARRLDAPSGPLAALVAEPASRDVLGVALLVPGYTGSKEDFLPVLAPLAAAGHRVVAVDLRGQHESGGPEDRAAYTLDALAKDVAGLADALGGPLHVVGHSFGGLVCRRAVINGLRPSSLALVGSGPAALGGTRAMLIEMMRPLLDDGGVAAVAEAAQALDDADPRMADVPSDVREFLVRRLRASPAAALRTMGEQLVGAPDEVDHLAATGVPVLVAHGAADDAWSPAEQQAMAARLRARHAEIAGSVHSPACEAPEALTAVLLDFWGSDRVATTGM
jgi:pimeloyl-ACP methyl ester carboxylesterase